MISSMTGFGRAKAATPIGQVSVEVRSLNYRFLEASVRVPSNLSFLEEAVRERIRSRLQRGKVDMFLKWEPSPDFEPAVVLNDTLLERLAVQYEAVRKRLKLEAPLDPSALLQMPQFLQIKAPELKEEAFLDAILPVVDKALDGLEKTRRREGRALRKALREYLGALDKGARRVHKFRDQMVEEYRERLRVRIDEILARDMSQADEGRLEMEVAIMSEKSDVAEEIVRLDNHIATFHKIVTPKEPEPVGRQLDFLCQELQREINTISAKCRSSELLNTTLEMKNLVEKLREQVQNIE